MARTIWKFVLDANLLTNVIPMPKGARILSLQMQRGEACIWALVSPDQPNVNRVLRVLATGHPLPDGDLGVFIDTFQVDNGSLVFHVFDSGEAA